MAELRQDPVSGRWIIIATERQARPHDFQRPRVPRQGGFCPFCEGNEDRTPPEVAAVRPGGGPADSPGWRVRVVPNKFPALQPDAQVHPHSHQGFHQVAGVGAHEVIIESPRHVVSPTQLAVDDYALVLQVCAERCRAHAGDRRLAYTLLFKNVGAAAGASIEHSHSQLIAVPVMPKRVLEEVTRCEQFHEDRQKCLFCHIIDLEREAGERVVSESENFVALAPFAPRFPFEMWVLPRAHTDRFHALRDEHAAELAGVVRDVLGRMEVCLDAPPFNYAVHTAPLWGQDPLVYHWHIEIIPRVTQVAGFEWGTGFYINPLSPEEATAYLRAVTDEQLEGLFQGTHADSGAAGGAVGPTPNTDTQTSVR